MLEICGTESNLEMASYVHDFLLRTSERLWREHKHAEGLRSDADRRSYLQGVMRGFRDKLSDEQKEQRQQGLVWVSDPGMGAYFDARHPRRTTLRRTTRTNAQAFAAGQQAGRSIVLNRPITGGAPSGGGPRALPPRRS